MATEFSASDNPHERQRAGMVRFPENLELASLQHQPDTEIAEPSYAQRVQEFPEATSTEEVTRVREAAARLIADTLDTYGDYLDTDYTQSDFLQMNHRAAKGSHYYMGVRPDQIELADNKSATMYRYYLDANHVMRRHDYSLSTFIGLPRLGEVTTETYMEIKDERLRQEDANHAFTQDMGLTDKTVGAAEISHIAGLVQRAEPINVRLTMLDTYYQRKLHAAPPSEEATQKAAQAFRRDIANHLDKRSDQAPVTTEIVSELGQHARMTVGYAMRDGQSEPYLNLTYNTNVGEGAKYYVRWHYYITDSQFLGERASWYEARSGERRAGSLFLQVLDSLEQSAIRNFLRKPTI